MSSINSAAQSSLLLLPPIPIPETFAELRAAYHAPLLDTFRSILQSAKPSCRRVLDIALSCPHLCDSQATRRELYAPTQVVVAKLYKLVCVVAAKEGINVEDAEGIDVRVLLLAYPVRKTLENLNALPSSAASEGPVIDIQTLSQCGRMWTKIYGVQSVDGERLLEDFVNSCRPSGEVQRVRSGKSLSLQTSRNLPSRVLADRRRFRHSAVGGTFDHLHIGHKLLLTMTVFPIDPPVDGEERAITVGITAKDLLANKKYAEHLEGWHERYASVHSFIDGIMSFGRSTDSMCIVTEVREPGPNGHAMLVRYPSGLTIHYVEIWDPFGPTITVEDIDALVISAETRSGGKAVNQKRKEKQWEELEVFEVEVLDAEEDEIVLGEGAQKAFQNKLSSTEIRKTQAERVKQRSKV